MFCTSLRRRPSFAAILPQLIQTQSLALKESQLDTHDLSLTLSTIVEPRTGLPTVQDRLHVLLLSPSCAKDEAAMCATLDRIRRFGDAFGIEAKLVTIFLLEPPREASFSSARHQLHEGNDEEAGRRALGDGWRAYNTLQWRIFEDDFVRTEIPLLPLPTLNELPNLLTRYAQGLTRPRPMAVEGMSEVSLRLALLRQCTASTEPMSEQTAFVLSDVFGSVRNLMRACTAPVTDANESNRDMAQGSSTPVSSLQEDPLKRLQGLVSDREIQDLIDFWREEWTVE